MTRGLKVGVVAFGVAVVAAVVGLPARGGVPAEAKYIGSKMCKACHQGPHPKQVTGWAASPHARALWKIEEADETHKVVGDFAKDAPFTKDKVAYVIGSGTREQAYLSADLKVLPGSWKVKEQKWVSQAAVDATKDCLGCHTSGYDPATAKWTEMGVNCEMCHGPGSVHAGSSDKKGTIVNPKNLDAAHQAMVCGRCHSSGKSKDGQLTFSPTFHPGDDLDQTFVPAQKVEQGARNAQYNEIRFGGGKHLAAGTECLSCHDPHSDKPMQLKAATVNETCLACHAGKLHGAQHSEGALKSMSCDKCHMPNGSHVFLTPHHG